MIDLTMLPPVGYRGSRHPTGYLAGHGSMLFQGLVVGKSGRIGVFKQHPPVSEKCKEPSIVCSHHTNPGFVHPRQVFHSPPCCLNNFFVSLVLDDLKSLKLNDVSVGRFQILFNWMTRRLSARLLLFCKTFVKLFFGTSFVH